VGQAKRNLSFHGMETWTSKKQFCVCWR